jgi:hypothetical protein
MIGLAAEFYDLDGDIVLRMPHSSTNIDDKARRATRIATLDGRAVLSDLGYTDGDRDLSITLQGYSEADKAVLERLVRYHSTIIISLPDGCYQGSPQSLRLRAGLLTLSVALVQRVSA